MTASKRTRSGNRDSQFVWKVGTVLGTISAPSRLLCSCVIFCVLLVVSSGASACPNGEMLRTVFWRSLPPENIAPFAARVTILQALRRPGDKVYKDASGEYSYQGIARIDSAVRGALNSKTIKVVLHPSDCDTRFRAGDSGLVAGTVKTLGDGTFELTAAAARVYF